MSLFTVFSDISIVVDRSGSMASLHGAQVEQIYKLICDKKQESIDNNTDVYLSLTTFDDQTETIINDKLNDYIIPSYQFFREKMSARGTTKFYDTVIECVDEQKKRVASNIKLLPRRVKRLEPAVSRIMYILTDGYDNASKHSRTYLKEIMEKERKDEHFTVIFLGANIGDVEETADTYGFSKDTALTIGNDYRNASIAMDQANSLIRDISQGAKNVAFTPLQRQMSVGQAI